MSYSVEGEGILVGEVNQNKNRGEKRPLQAVTFDYYVEKGRRETAW